tara:strand:- start:22886 stop:23338 length:453 start_codon:yes stop_codon:yes gene_type:complete
MSEDRKTIFITHAFRFHVPWKKLNFLIETRLSKSYLNVSTPWHDPSFVPFDEWGRSMIKETLLSQSSNVDLLIIIESLTTKKSMEKYINLEIINALDSSKNLEIFIYADLSDGKGLREILKEKLDIKEDKRIDKCKIFCDPINLITAINL